MVNIVQEADPKNYKEAIKSELRDKWRIAMTEKLDAPKNNGYWRVEVLQFKNHMLHTKWVYKTKTDGDGAIERFKARLVVCGNEQI